MPTRVAARVLGCEDPTTRLGDAPQAQQAAVRDAADAYRAAGSERDLRCRVATDPRRHRRCTSRGGVAALLAVPVVVGAVSTPCGPHLARARPMAPVTRATVKFLVAIVCFPLTWLVVATSPVRARRTRG
jgi:hypothetical protein